MSNLVLLLSLSALSAVVHGVETHDFESYSARHKLKYSSELERAARKNTFEQEMKRIEEHNKKNLSWKEGVNKFTSMTQAEKKRFLGRSKGAAAAHNKLTEGRRGLPEDFKLEPVESLPRMVDWRAQGIMSAVKDQGYCGSCWAFASTAVIESHVAKASALLFDLSVQQVTSCAPNPDMCGGTGGCMGSTAELAFDYATKSGGLFEEFQYSYASYLGNQTACAAMPDIMPPVAAIDGYVQLPINNYLALMNAVARIGPVAINVDASSWFAYESGLFRGCSTDSPDVNHVVVLAGYGEDADGQKFWLVRNSWAPTWGERGYMRLHRSDADEEHCGMDVTPQDGVACSGDTAPQKVCGTCGAIYDASYPLNARVL